jgi:hypothetical protein
LTTAWAEGSSKAVKATIRQFSNILRYECLVPALPSHGEVGAVTLKRRNIGKGKERVEILLAGAE